MIYIISQKSFIKKMELKLKSIKFELLTQKYYFLIKKDV